MRRIAFVNTVVAGAGLLFLCMLAGLAVGQSAPAGAAPDARMASTATPPGKSAAPLDMLEGLTLADEQKAKIAQIREDTKSRVLVMERDRQLSPEAADAMRRGYQRLENGRILEVLTPEQQKQVRARVAAWRAAKEKPQYPARQTPGSGQPDQPQ